MKNAIEDAIKVLAKKIAGDVKSGDALHYTQAALNLAQTAATLANTKKHLE